MKIHRLLLPASLLLAGCATTRHISSERTFRTTDSTTNIRTAVSGDTQRTQHAASRQQAGLSIVRSETTEAVPAQTATLHVTCEMLAELPEGASYTTRTGNLLLEARRSGDTLRLTAHSDSLARRSVRYEHTALRRSETSDSLGERLRQRQQTDQVQTHTASAHEEQASEKQTRSTATWYWWLLLGLSAGIPAGWYLCRKWR